MGPQRRSVSKFPETVNMSVYMVKGALADMVRTNPLIFQVDPMMQSKGPSARSQKGQRRG